MTLCEKIKTAPGSVESVECGVQRFFKTDWFCIKCGRQGTWYKNGYECESGYLAICPSCDSTYFTSHTPLEDLGSMKHAYWEFSDEAIKQMKKIT